MRRSVVLSLSLLGLVLPAGALASRALPTDGQLVVRNGSAPAGTPVVTLAIDGSVIASIQGSPAWPAKVVITTLNQGDGYSPEVTGDAVARDVQDSKTVWVGTSFRLRSIGVPGHYVKIAFYGSDVDVIAIGRGQVRLAGTPDATAASPDGVYSISGSRFTSLPPQQTAWLPVAPPASG